MAKGGIKPKESETDIEADLRPRRASLVSEISTELSQQIRRGAFGDSGRLPPERSLAVRMGVSRPVLREAVKQLQSQGLLEVRHGVGVMVTDTLHKPINTSIELALPAPKERLRQLTELRSIVEPEAARLAAGRASAPQLAELLGAQRALAHAKSNLEVLESDLRFHRALARASGNHIYVLLLDCIGDLGWSSAGAAGVQPGRQFESLRLREHSEHQRIFEAIEKGDANRAASAMRRHLRNAAPPPVVGE